MKKLLLRLLLIICLIGSNAQAQFVFRHIDIINGLSDNQIRSITQTPDGRIAIRTASILNIYNGAEFNHFYQNKRKEYKWEYMRTPKEYYDSKGRIWMKERDYLLLLDLNNGIFNYEISGELKKMGVQQAIKNLFVDNYKNFWLVSIDKTLSLYDQRHNKLHIIENGKSEFTKKYGVPIEIVQYKNRCWMVYNSGLIRSWDYASKEFIQWDETFVNRITPTTDRISIKSDSQGNIWLMYNNGVYYYHRNLQRWRQVATIAGLSNFFTCMDLDKDGNAWVGTSRSGLRFINRKTWDIETISGMKLEHGGTIRNDIYSVFVDNNNGVWVGTLFQGLCYYHPSINKFKLIQTIDNETRITNEDVRCFLENTDGTVLVGNGLGLFKFYPSTGKIEKQYTSQIKDLCLSLYRDSQGRTWVGTYFQGFFCITGNSVRNYIHSTTNLDKSPNQNVSRAIFEDATGQFWASTNEGIGRFDTNTGGLRMLSEEFPQLKTYKVCYNFYPINKDEFAVVGENGIFFYNSKKNKVWIPQSDSPQNPKFVDYDTKYYCILKDKHGLEWYGTELGIRIWDNSRKKLYKLTTADGIPNNTISSILEDNQGYIWAATASGLTKISVTCKNGTLHFSLINFGASDRLQSGKFYDRSALKTHDGTIYFGGVHGFNYVNPQSMTYNKGTATPLFTGFSLFNTAITKDQKYNNRVILSKPINQTSIIELRYNENFISIEFSGLNFVNPNQTYYRYKLVNFDHDWIETDATTTGKATYTGLKPGKYKLVVYAANNDKVWSSNPAELSIIVNDPFWATRWAIAVYLILCIAAAYFVLTQILRQQEKKAAKQRALVERKQVEELNQMKFKFFTNVSHEFRTPLTLIITPLETIIRKIEDQDLKTKLSLINQNANRLLELVNQLLDFRKLEINGEKLQLKKGDIMQFVENIFFQFKESVANQNINFSLENENSRLIMYFDHDKMHKILNNLLSNSLKFTPEGGQISIHTSTTTHDDRKFVSISVTDTGEGISEVDKDHIFDRFYQTNTHRTLQGGSGIGLHILKEYVVMHGGQISVRSQIGKGSVFTVTLPIDLTCPAPENTRIEVAPLQQKPNTHSSRKKRTILFIEDNNEFRSFLKEQLNEEFNVIEAADGEAGKEQAFLHSPDLIVSDLMMPKMDGIELCLQLKSDIRTSHIPFILLTALNSDEDKTKGYEVGADSYISKPFSFEMLQTRISKLIEQQQKRQDLFHKTIEITPSSITITSLDEELVQKALLFVEKNMDNTEYSIDDLGKDIGLSRSQLYRKLQSITGLSPIEFIRSIRLKRAAQLLTGSQYNVSEIADIVGFNTLKYFNKYFKDEFGMTPTQYRQENKKD